MSKIISSVRSKLLTISMLPKRKLIKFGAYPGVSITKRTPMAIPTDHSIPIAVSSRSVLRDIDSIVSAEISAPISAPIVGLIPI